MKGTIAILSLALGASLAPAQPLLPGAVQLLCHRTANEDTPENTLESLQQAALLGCNTVEIDLRRTLDGRIVLNHDGILERLTDGTGDVEQSYYGDLTERDFGSWMSARFAGMHVALFEDALRLARELDIRLILDIKDKGLATDVLRMLEREGMLQRVQFNGEWEDVKKLYPQATGPGDGAIWVQPGVTAAQVREYHLQGKAVITNFSANEHLMDLDGMKAAVAAGVDAINVDFPRLGADAVGRPVERRIGELIKKANAGESDSRVTAIIDLSKYSGFPLQSEFARWLLDTDDHVSRAAAVALVSARPQTPVFIFAAGVQSPNADARANSAWALGVIRAPASAIVPLLADKDSLVLQAALQALGRAPGDVSEALLLPLLSNEDPAVRGAAAIALARHQPEAAVKEIPKQLKQEMASERVLYDEHKKRGGEHFTKPEIAAIMKSFRCQMEMMRAISMLRQDEGTRELVAQALRPGKDFSQFNGIIAGFQLWDRAVSNAEPIVAALSSTDKDIADRAEWTLVKAGSEVLPEVREALDSTSSAARQRAIHIVAWQGDAGSLDKLAAIQTAGGSNAALAAWAIEKIETLHPRP